MIVVVNKQFNRKLAVTYSVSKGIVGMYPGLLPNMTNGSYAVKRSQSVQF